MAAGGANEQTWWRIEEIDVPLPVPAGHALLTMKLCRIPAGSFRMGARDGRAFEKGNEEPVHEVEVPYDFWMAKHVVTQEQYAAVFEALELARPDDTSRSARPSRFKVNPDHPVETVSWIDATLWCQKLSAWWQANCPPQLSAWCGGSRVVCSLPTEIEWEYACRAGTETEYWCGDDDEDLRRVAWFGEDYKGSTHSVDALVSRDGDVANAFGLVGVHGNVWEWCRDAYQLDAFAPHAAGRRAERQQDGADEISDDRLRVFRGGSWYFTAWGCRSAY
ncbi:MAG: formylglycine-generating enzyme family protein, partial [Planctomycetota bacterium]